MFFIFKDIDWKLNDYGPTAQSCEFKTTDLTSMTSLMNDCSKLCNDRIRNGCSHYTWKNGICYLKTGEITKMQAINNNNQQTLCGIIRCKNLKKFYFKFLFSLN